MDFDKGKYIRSEDRYKNLLDGYKFILARNKYLNFDYDHLISVKNLKTDKIREILKIQQQIIAKDKAVIKNREAIKVLFKLKL